MDVGTSHELETTIPTLCRTTATKERGAESAPRGGAVVFTVCGTCVWVWVPA